jgi:hypothetical protein
VRSPAQTAAGANASAAAKTVENLIILTSHNDFKG